MNKSNWIMFRILMNTLNALNNMNGNPYYNLKKLLLMKVKLKTFSRNY